MAASANAARLAAGALREDQRPRWRFAASLGLCGAALGGAIVVTNVVGQTSKFAVDADMLPFGDFLYFWFIGAVTGSIVAGLAGYMINRSAPAFSSTRLRPPLSIWAWAAVGAGYWVSFSVVIGGGVMPEANVVLAYVRGAIPLADLAGFTADNIFAFPLRAATDGPGFLFTAIPAAAAFWLGGWAVDRLATSAHGPSNRYGPLVASLAVFSVVTAALVLLPPHILWHIGNFTTATQLPR